MYACINNGNADLSVGWRPSMMIFVDFKNLALFNF